MSNKHPKLPRPTNVDLVRNPLIGGSKGVTMAQAGPDDLDQLAGANTIEGDVENDTNPQGGIDKADVQNRRRAPPKPEHGGPSRHLQLQGKKTHEQQLRMLERKPDVPDARQVEQEIARDLHDGGTKLPLQGGRQSEFAISRGGMNQESQHNKHNHPPRGAQKQV